jgi:hypothetical protein
LCANAKVIPGDKDEYFDHKKAAYHFSHCSTGYIDPEDAFFTEGQFSLLYQLRDLNFKRAVANGKFKIQSHIPRQKGEVIIFAKDRVYRAAANEGERWLDYNVFMITRHYGFTLNLFFSFVRLFLDKSIYTIGAFVNMQNNHYRCRRGCGPFTMHADLFSDFVFGVICSMGLKYHTRGCKACGVL